MPPKAERKVSVNTWRVWQEAFQMFDLDKDGHITSEEVTRVMQKFDIFPTEGEVKDVVHEIDLNHSGTIDVTDFISLMEHRYRDAKAVYNPHEEEEDLRAAFDLFDRDHDGRINLDDMQRVLKSLGEEVSTETLLSILQESYKETPGDNHLSNTVHEEGSSSTSSGSSRSNPRIDFNDFYRILKRATSQDDSGNAPSPQNNTSNHN